MFDREKRLLDNATILSRFKWTSNVNHKKCMAFVLVGLIVLFILRYPIYKYLSRVPDVPVFDVASCQMAGPLRVTDVHVSPGADARRVHITFSANLPTNGMISVQYGAFGVTDFEAFTSHHKLTASKEQPHVFTATIMITNPGLEYSYRINCGAYSTDVYKFKSWKMSNFWSPKVTMVTGQSAKESLISLQSDRADLAVQLGWTEQLIRNDSTDVSRNALAGLPLILLAESPQDAAMEEQLWRFSLPDAEWMSMFDTFYTTVGPLQIVGFNATALKGDNSKFELYKLNSRLVKCESVRASLPWVILVSYEPMLCAGSSGQSCVSFMSLLAKYHVDLYIASQSDMYKRSWPLAADETPLTTYHNAAGVVIIQLADGSTPRSPLPTPSDDRKLYAKISPHVDHIQLLLDLPAPSSLCLKVNSGTPSTPLDHFCIEKKSALSTALKEKSWWDNTSRTDSYSFTVWLVLVILLSFAFIALLIGRAHLYKKLCVYMRSDGGVPLYSGKLLAV